MGGYSSLCTAAEYTARDTENRSISKASSSSLKDVFEDGSSTTDHSRAKCCFVGREQNSGHHKSFLNGMKQNGR
jgi:hypothetical protein